MDTVSIWTSRKNQAFGLGILSDFKHAATDHSMPLWVSQGRTMDTVSIWTSRKNQAFGLGILSDFKHAATDHSMPLWVSQGHYECYGWPYGRKI